MIGPGDVDDVDVLVVENRLRIRGASRLIAGPFHDDPTCQIPPSRLRITDRDVVAVFAKVGSRSPRAVDARRLPALATASADGPDTWSLIGRDKLTGEIGSVEKSSRDPEGPC